MSSIMSGGTAGGASGAGDAGRGSDDAILPMAIYRQDIYRQSWEDAGRAPSSSAPPVPILIVRKVIEVAGVPIQLIWERWRRRDLWACPHRTELEVDPGRPDEVVGARFIDLSTGLPVSVLTPEQTEAWAGARPRAGRPGPPSCDPAG